jgi:hypothetical protein
MKPYILSDTNSQIDFHLRMNPHESQLPRIQKIHGTPGPKDKA